MFFWNLLFDRNTVRLELYLCVKIIKHTLVWYFPRLSTSHATTLNTCLFRIVKITSQLCQRTLTELKGSFKFWNYRRNDEVKLLEAPASNFIFTGVSKHICARVAWNWRWYSDGQMISWLALLYYAIGMKAKHQDLDKNI